jgi:hypothetical protein
MPGPVTNVLGRTVLSRAARRVPVLKRIPILRLLALAEVAVLAREHVTKLEPEEWRRMLELIRIGRGRPSNLSMRQRRELKSLVAKAEPRLFAGEAMEKLSPVHIPKRLAYGPSKGKR